MPGVENKFSLTRMKSKFQLPGETTNTSDNLTSIVLLHKSEIFWGYGFEQTW